jgi:hypothetical protein
MNALRDWITAAKAVRPTCQNKAAFDELIASQRQRLERLTTPIVKAGVGTKVLIPTAEIGRDVANFTVGFGLLSVRDGVEHVELAGSGSRVPWSLWTEFAES